MTYPGRVIQLGETSRNVVRAIATALEQAGYEIRGARSKFDAALASTVKLFQSQHLDTLGRPLKIDGKVGPLTWHSLFGATESEPLAGSVGAAALRVAAGEVGVLEAPPGTHRGRRVEEYLHSVGLGPGNYWCMAFVHFCFLIAAEGEGVPNPFPRTGLCAAAWATVRRDSPKSLVTREDARESPDLVRPGMVFVHDYGNGHGHTGFVLAAVGGALRTVEGNSNPAGSSNGIGVFELNRRNVMDQSLRGFIAF